MRKPVLLPLVIACLILGVLFSGCLSSSPSQTTTAPEHAVVSSAGQFPNFTYPIVDTGQVLCYDNTQAIPCPSPGQPFYGQDAQYAGNLPAYTVSSDGLTVYDKVTGLTWQRSPDSNDDGSLTKSDKMTLAQAQAYPATLNAEKFGGYDDWRLPTIRELYSLIDYQGTDPNPSATDTSGLTPFINTSVFGFAYGQPSGGETVGNRIIDSQYVSGTQDVSTGWNGAKVFGVNFADGRIKGYGISSPGGAMTFFVLCVRGNPAYGKNSFTDNGDGTITDKATGLMWSKGDSGTGMDWEEALAWVQAKNTGQYLGYSDWRLPDAKELQSIVDYTRSPDTTGSAAIDPLFTSTQITNEAGQADYPYYWTSTTHASAGGQGIAAVYIAFGRAMGYMNGAWQDVHGAGAQRSDPKTGSAADYPQGRGPQGDAIRIDNYVRLVRGGVTGYTGSSAAQARPSSAAGQAVTVQSQGAGVQGNLPEPPAAAVAACNGKSPGAQCSFTGLHGVVQGTCAPVGRENTVACAGETAPAR